MDNYTLHDPYWLLLLLLLPLGFWLRSLRSVQVLLVPFAAAWHRPSLVAPARWPVALGTIGLTLLVAALARPQKIEDKIREHNRGYDLMLCIDLSGSMLSEDYQKDGERLNRLQAITPVVDAFIQKRPNDRIGIVVFAGRAYTLSPLTFDHAWLGTQVKRLNIGLIEDGTAIGDGLGIALTRLEQAAHENAGRRLGAFVVLLTDGVNNRGTLSPEQATEIASARGIPVYTIGAGTNGFAPFPIFRDGVKIGYQRIQTDLDEGALRTISNKTNGRFFRAADMQTIQSAFDTIDKSQKIEFEAKTYLITTELFAWIAAPGLALLLLAAWLVRAPSAPRTAAGPPGTSAALPSSLKP